MGAAGRAQPGTTVVVHDLYYNMPVRRKRLSDTLTLEHVRRRVECLYLAQPDVAVTLVNELTGWLLAARVRLSVCRGAAGAGAVVRGPAARVRTSVWPQQGRQPARRERGAGRTGRGGARILWARPAPQRPPPISLLQPAVVGSVAAAQAAGRAVCRIRHRAGAGAAARRWCDGARHEHYPMHADMPSTRHCAARHGVFCLRVEVPEGPPDAEGDVAEQHVPALEELVKALLAQFMAEYHLLLNDPARAVALFDLPLPPNSRTALLLTTEHSLECSSRRGSRGGAGRPLAGRCVCCTASLSVPRPAESASNVPDTDVVADADLEEHAVPRPPLDLLRFQYTAPNPRFLAYKTAQRRRQPERASTPRLKEICAGSAVSQLLLTPPRLGRGDELEFGVKRPRSDLRVADPIDDNTERDEEPWSPMGADELAFAASRDVSSTLHRAQEEAEQSVLRTGPAAVPAMRCPRAAHVLALTAAAHDRGSTSRA